MPTQWRCRCVARQKRMRDAKHAGGRKYAAPEQIECGEDHRRHRHLCAQCGTLRTARGTWAMATGRRCAAADRVATDALRSPPPSEVVTKRAAGAHRIRCRRNRDGGDAARARTTLFERGGVRGSYPTVPGLSSRRGARRGVQLSRPPLSATQSLGCGGGEPDHRSPCWPGSRWRGKRDAPPPSATPRWCRPIAT